MEIIFNWKIPTKCWREETAAAPFISCEAEEEDAGEPVISSRQPPRSETTHTGFKGAPDTVASPQDVHELL